MASSAGTTYLWLDCDPGHDDAMAIVLATHGHDPTVIVAGVSTVCGNQTLDKTTANALRVLHLVARDDVQVHRGAAKPLTRARRTCAEIHGETGLDGPDIPPAPRDANPAPAVTAMASAFYRILEIPSARPVLVATGALTNVALLFSVYPELATRVELVIMGGALGKGNTGPCAEFNIQCDPEAAHVVFESGARVRMVPLEVTHTALVTPEIRARLLWGKHPPSDASHGDSGGARRPSRFRALVDELMRFFASSYEEVFGFEHPPLHDPCAVYAAIAPDAFEWRSVRVDVETSSALTAGQTVVDWWRQSPERPINCEVGVKMDVERFWRAMCEAVDNANAACPMK